VNSGTFTGQTAVQVNSVFTSTYSNYKLVFENMGTAAGTHGANIQLTASGTASTAPSLGGSTAVLNGAVQSFDFGNGYSMSYNRPTSSASLITSVVASNLSYITPITFIAIY